MAIFCYLTHWYSRQRTPLSSNYVVAGKDEASPERTQLARKIGDKETCRKSNDSSENYVEVVDSLRDLVKFGLKENGRQSKTHKWLVSRCDILSPLKELCPEAQVVAFDDGTGSAKSQDATLIQTFDLTPHDFNGFFDKVKFVVNLDFIQWNTKCFVRQTLFQVRDVKSTMDLA
ncbi:hypothetical protein Tco_0569051 [Tanacetum coccineum]